MPELSPDTPAPGDAAGEPGTELERLTRMRDALLGGFAGARAVNGSLPSEAQSLMSPLASMLSDLVSLHSDDGTLIHCSPSVERTLGWRSEEVAGMSLGELIHPVDLSKLHEAIGAHRTPSAPVEIRVRRSDGSHAWLELRAARVTFDGAPHLLFVSSEISRRKEAEETLRERASWTQRLIDRTNLGILRVDADGRILHVNPAFIEMLGHEGEADLTGLELHDVLGSAAVELEQSLATGKSRSRSGPEDLTWSRRDGSELHVRLNASLVHDADGALESFELIVEDVTEDRRTELRLRRAERLAGLGRMLAGMAHELNNPLAAICGFAQLLARSELDVEDRAAVDTIAREGQRAAHIVRQLLAFSRHDGAALMEPVDASEVVTYIARSQRYALETHGIRCTVDLPPESAWVTAERGQLEQIVLNLLVNARHACMEKLDDLTYSIDSSESPLSLEPPFVRLSVRVLDDMVWIEVSDSGKGIEADDLARIWDPFFTTKADGEGSGLGLAVVHAAVVALGGQIDVRSEAGLGTSFQVRLPRVAALHPSPDHGDEGARQPGAHDVLLIGSTPLDPRFVERFLRERGHAVITVPTMEAALRILADVAFDVVILNLPAAAGASASDAVSRLRGAHGGETSRVVVAARRIARTARDQLEQIADVVLLQHPADVDRLRQAVEQPGGRSEVPVLP